MQDFEVRGLSHNDIKLVRTHVQHCLSCIVSLRVCVQPQKKEQAIYSDHQ